MLTDLKGVIDINVIIVEDFSTLLSTMDRSFRRNIKKKTLDLELYLRPNGPKRHIKNTPSNST